MISIRGKERSVRRKFQDKVRHIQQRIAGKGNCLKKIMTSQDGMGVVEVILIIVVLIGLVIIFQTNIKSVVASIFSTIQKNAGSIR